MVKDMTEGSISRHLVAYAVPLILGNLFQLTYNAVDSIIVGRFIGKEALAAVGTASPVMNIIILGISGICIGASVLMSGFFGAKEEDMVKREMATTAVFGVYFSLIVVFLGILVTKPLLRALYVPAEILETASSYLRIIFLGAPFTFFYNAIASALKSVGDSKTPLKFLALCSVLNGVLDVVFIGVLHFGITCSAVTTVVAEALSAVLCVVYVYRKIPLLQLKPGEFKVDRGLLRQTLQYGSVTALQQSCQPIGKLLIQGAVNPMGVDVMAAFNAVNKIDAYAFTPEQSISNAITTFVAQNSGAGKEERIRKGFGTGMFLEFCYWILICGTILLLRAPLMKLFVGEAGDIVALGSSYLGIMAFFYMLPGFTNGMQGYFRGTKHMKMTLLGTFIQTSLRVVFVYVLTPKLGLPGVAFACAVGWVMMLAVEIPYYFWISRKSVRK